jgi:hypothetical protein
MCTIGNVFTPNAIGNFSFKQCDLMDLTNFCVPNIVTGKEDIRYLPFLRNGSSGPWAGVNNYGVSFVAADSYLAKTGQLNAVNTDIFAEYTKIISNCKTAKVAATNMYEFYQSFLSPDILQINDAKSSFFIEAHGGEKDGGKVVCIERRDNFFASTNHFRMLPGATPYVQNHSTYLRLQRAQAILQEQTSVAGITDVLTDQYFGKTVLSVCRVNQQKLPTEEPYYTQATALFFCGESCVRCAYQLNGNPRSNTFTFIDDVFGSAKKKEDVAVDELAALFQ